MKSCLPIWRIAAPVFIFASCLFSVRAFAQTTLISPTGDGGFENGATFAANGWSSDNGSATNKWFVGTVPPGFTNNVAYVSNDNGTTWSYTNTTTSVVHFWRDITFPAGETSINLSFNWQALGEASSWDALMVSLAPTSYTPVASTTSLGTGALAAPAVTLVQLWNVGSPQTANISIPGSLVGNCSAPVTLRLIFTWKNDGTAGTPPPAAIDNISLTSQSAGAPLTGTLTVGPTGNYTTLTAAVNDLAAKGAAGPVVFELQSTYSSGGETFPIILGPYCNASSTNTATIRPEAGATALSVTGSNAGPTFDINSGNWWRLDGRPGGTGSAKELIISNTSTAGQAIRFINDGSNNIVRYCDVRGVNTSTTNGVILFSTTVFNNGNDNNLIDNCDVHDGATTPANCIYSSGTSTSLNQFNSNNTVSNCNIFNFFLSTSTSFGIVVTTGSTEWTITGNSFYQTAARTLAAAIFGAIQMPLTTSNYHVITNNFIGGTAPQCGGGPMTLTGAGNFRGMNMTVGPGTTLVQGNTVQNINLTTSNATGFNGALLLGQGNFNVNSNTIGSLSSNGSIAVTASGSAFIFCGIILGGTSPTNTSTISNNSIGGISLTVSGAPTTPGSIRCISVQGTVANHNYIITGNTVGSTTTADNITADGNVSGSIIGIVSFSTALSQQITNNTVSNLTSTNSGTATTLWGILAQGGATTGAFTGTFTCAENTVQNIKLGSGNTANFSLTGIQVSPGNGTVGTTIVRQNTVRNLQQTNTGVGTSMAGMVISLPTVTSNTVERNFIHSLNMATTTNTGATVGILLAGGTSNVQNNMIRLGVDGTGADITSGFGMTGIQESAGNNNIRFNSVYIGGAGVSAGTSNTFGLNSVVTTGARNYISNILYNARSNGAGTGKHYAIAFGGTAPNPAGIASNYNDLFATGTGGFVGLFNAADQATLAAWRTATGNDFQSISGDPQFIAPNGNSATVDLHIQAASATPVEAGGQPVSGVTNDFDGQTRNGLTPTDIGADAGNFVLSDISGPGIGYTPLAGACGTGNISLTGVNITDGTGIPTAGALAPRIYYRKNADSYFSSPGTLASGGATNGIWNFTIVAADMGGIAPGDVISYYVIAQDNLGNIGSNAGGAVATDVNTVTTHPVTPNTVTVQTALSGTYTVGAGGAYTTLTAAIADYNTKCLTGPVVFSLTDATYPGETFPITINANASASATNTLTIKPAAGVTASITGTATTALIILNGADWITIDGSNGTTSNSICPPSAATRDLTIMNTNTGTASAVIWFQNVTGTPNGATNNKVINCNIAGNGPAQTLTCIGMGSPTIGTASLGTNNSNNAFINNNLSNAQYGVVTQGNSAFNKNTGNVINQNLMNTVAPANMGTGGILAGFEDNITVSGNRISEIIRTGSPDACAINLGFGHSLFLFSTFGGNEVTNATVTNNVIGSVTNSGTFSAVGIGLVSAQSGTSLIANNTVSGVAANGTASDFGGGIVIGGGPGSTTKVYHNTVSMSGTIPGATAASTLSIAFGVTGNAPANIDVRNNLFSNTQLPNTGTATVKFFSIGLGYASLAGNYANLVSDYNDLFVSPGSNRYLGTTGGLNAGIFRPTLADWRMETGRDLNSFSVQPNFISATDLHLTANNNQCLDGGALALTEVPADIDCQTRDVNSPDIGADEFTSPNLTLTVAESSGIANDDGITCAGSDVTLTATGGGTYSWSTGSNDNPIVVNPTTTTTYTVTITNGTCTDVLEATITVIALPTAFAVTGGGEYCAPGAGVPVGLSGSETGTSYQLRLDGVDTGAPLAGTGAALSFGNQTLSGTYTVVATNPSTACTAAMTGSATVTANSTPTAFTVTGGGAYCAPGAGVPVGLGSSETNVNYQLQLNGSNTGAPVAGTGAAISFGNQTEAGTYTVVATGTIGGCTANMSGSAVVVANSTPVLSETHVEPTTCVSTNGSIDLTVTGGTGPFAYNWATPNGNGLIQGQEDQSGLTVGTYLVTVTDANTCSATLAIPLAGPGNCDACPAVGSVSASPNGACANAPVTLTASSLFDMGTTYGITFKYFDAPTMTPYTGGTLISTVPNANLGNGGTTAETSTSFAAGGTYFIYAILDQNPTDPGCRPFAQTTLTVVDIPSVDAVSNQTVCNGSSTTAVNFTGPVPGTIFNWTNDNASIGLAASGSGNIASFAAVNNGTAPVTATITVTPVTAPTTGAECTGASITFTITVNPVPSVNAIANQTFCVGAPVPSVVFTGNVPGAVFSWSRTNEAIGLAATSGTGNVPSFTATNATTAALTSTFSVVASFTNNGITCTGTPIQFTITVNPTPTVSATPLSQTICNGSATTAIDFTTTVPGTIFNWTNNTPSIGLAASGSGNITSFTASNAGGAPVTATITVTPTFINNGLPCTGTPVNVTITVNPTAQVNQPANLSVCSNTLTTVNFTTTTPGSTFSWTNNNTAIGLGASGTGNISFTSATVLTATTATITVTPNYTNNGVSCPGTPRTFTITVNPVPSMSAVPSQTLCSGEATAAITFTGSLPGTAFNWTNNNTSIGLAASGSGNIASFVTANSGATTQVATVTVTPVLVTGGTSCFGTPVTFTITVYPRPIVNVGADQVICQNQAATLTAQLGGGATGGTWTGGAGAYGDANSATTTYTPAASEYGTTITLTFTSNDPAGPCPAVSDALQLTINTLPIVTAGADAKVCVGDVLNLSVLGASITANGSGVTTGTWSTTGSGTFQPNNNFPGATTYVPSAADYAAGFVNLRLTSADPAGPCNSVFDAALLTFKGPEALVCNDNVQVSLNGDGIAEVLPDMILEGSFDDDFFTVAVYQNNLSIGNTVTCAHVGKTLQVRVTDNCSGIFCWGTIKVEDKWAPALTCEDVHVICAVTNYEPSYLEDVLGIDNAYPAVAENCPPATLSFVDDWFDLDCDAQYSARILRKWTAVDASGNKGSCNQNIYFDRRHVSDVLYPADVTISCNGNVNTTPQATGAPYLSAFGRQWPIFPNAGNCEMQSAYVDQVLPVCDGTVKIIRTWTVYDWCLPTSPTPPLNPFYYIQVIKVTDDQGPTLACPANITVSTDPFSCCATTNLPDVVVEDACSRINSASARVLVWDPETGDLLATHDFDGSLTTFPGNNLWAPDTLAAFGFTPCLPIGAHLVTYTVTDDCGNTSTCTYRLTVDDGTPPVSACDEFTQVGLGGDGMAFVNASTFDDGSYDNCSDVTFKARRMNDNDCQDPDFFYDQVKFCCEDINDTITVVFRVYDIPVPAGTVDPEDYPGDYNDCMVQVFVEDKIKPTCVPPANASVSCENFDPSLWAYGFATSTDNCCIDTITAANNLSAFDTVCNKGTITRTFRAIDCGGQSTTCTQRIFVSYEQDYFVRFPNDVIVTVCDGTGNYGEPVFFGEDCELLGVSFEDEVFTVVPDACFKIERTWTIINWCTYNPNAGCIEVPNPNPNAIVNHPTNLTGPTISALGTPSPWTPSNVAVAPGQANTNYSVFYHGGTYNGQTIPNIANNNCYRYKQIIKIIDTQDPVVQCPASPVEVCDLTPNDPLLWNKMYWYDATINSHDLCEAPADLCITATDLCSGSNISIRYLLFLDLDGDGTMESVVNSNNLGIAGLGWNAIPYGNAGNPNYGGGEIRQFDDRPVPLNQKYGFAIQTTTSGVNKTACVRWNTQQQQNTYVVPELPYGTHKIKWFIEDGCGNETVCEYTFVVKDCKKPTVVCINGLSVNIMPTKMITLWASDFLQYTEDNCTPSNQLKIGIRKSGTGTGFPLNPDGTPQTSVTFTCDELGTQLVELWSVDVAGNADYCETYVIVQDNMGACSGNSAVIAGTLATESGNGLEEAQVGVGGMNATTDANGDYQLFLPLGPDYTVTPLKDNDPLNGVSTFDLVLINKHILGLEPLNTPYKMIAADANNSRSITTFDIVELRKLILGIYTELPNNTSWRFVDEYYQFPNPSNPFMDIFPETKQIANLQSPMLNQDFVAVKTGDVNGNAVTSSLFQAEDRASGELLFDVTPTVSRREIKSGETFTLNFRASEKVKGYQFTLYFPNLEVVEVTPGADMTMGNFGIFNDQHALTTSFDKEQVQGEFAVTFRSKSAGELSKLLTVSSRITKAEAYRNDAMTNDAMTPMSIALRFNGETGATIVGQGFELYQNQPNPWLNRTQIGFYLPDAAEVSLTVYDETGRILFGQTGDFGKGYNVFNLDRELMNTTGLLYYKVETPTDSAVKKMIQAK